MRENLPSEDPPMEPVPEDPPMEPVPPEESDERPPPSPALGTTRFRVNPPPTCRESPRRLTSLRRYRTETKASGPDSKGVTIAR